MKSKQYIAVLCLLSGAISARADLSLDFESLPNTYINGSLNAQDIGNNYNGPYVAPASGGSWVNFGAGIQGTPGTIGSVAFGTFAFGSFVNGNIGLLSNDPLGTFSATFNPLLGAVSSVSFVYSSFLGMTFVGGGSTLALPTTVDGQGVNHPTLFTFNGVLTGFELQDNAGDTANNPLYDPQNGDSNNLIGEFGSGFSLVDDLSVTSRNTPELLPTGGTVPDASSTLGLLGLAGAGMLALRRKAVVS